MVTPFNSEDELRQIRDRITAQKKPSKRSDYQKKRSALDSYLNEIISLRNSGATYEEIKEYLSSQKLHVHITTVMRFLKKHAL